ncbi:MAG: hypothetical protein E7576_09575 [Ruminococcaceae bacterium]|jgi:predicted GH43/DUF377 family glycosyl hydrolase|nr:hypothetical protein [Oscillospiraceae bacterium]
MTTGSFKKYPTPVFGGPETGTMFDAFIRKQPDGRLRMDVSWRPRESFAVTFSDDGIHWSEPVITLGPNQASGWEQIVNRNCVLPDPAGDGWLMWYTGQVWEGGHGKSWIGIARSDDGIRFERFRENPVLVPEADFEKESVMNPFVMFENGKFKMWYAAGETYEPNVICYAESDDGINWIKYSENPIFRSNPEKEYEQERIGACDVLKEDDGGYLMFYIGYRDIHTACVCAARSKDGITGWERVPENPLVMPTPDAWDAESCYKPTVVQADDGTYRLWYNGRRGGAEFIGYAEGRIAPGK